MKSQVKIAWATYQVGMVIDPPGLLFDQLSRTGFVVAVPEDTPICLAPPYPVIPEPVVEEAAPEVPAKKPSKRKRD
jgi:hypothetical protein